MGKKTSKNTYKTRGIWGLITGVVCWILIGIFRIPSAGLLIGGMVCGAAIGMGVLYLFKLSSLDKLTSYILMGAGAFGILCVCIPTLALIIFGLGGLALIVYAVYSFIQYKQAADEAKLSKA